MKSKKLLSLGLMGLFGLLAFSLSSGQVVKADTVPGVAYRGHVQNIGWQDYVSDGAEAGTDGKGYRVEALNIKLVNAPQGAHIQYQGHVENIGWQQVVSDGDEIGTDGKGLRVEAFKLALTGMPGYSIQYRAHVQNIGWQPWVSDGAEAGTDGRGLRVEAIEIKVVKTTDGSTPVPADFVTPNTITLPYESQDYTVINEKNADIDGDSVNENVVLAGIKNDYGDYNGLCLVIIDPKDGHFKNYTKIDNETSDNRNAMFLNDYTGDGISDIRLNLDSGGSSAINYCYIFSMQSGQLNELFNKSLNDQGENPSFSYEMADPYTLNITLGLDKSIYAVDLSKDNAVVNYADEVEPYLGHGPRYNDVENDDGSCSLREVVNFSGVCHADILADVNTIYKYDKDKDEFVTVNQQVTSNYPFHNILLNK